MAVPPDLNLPDGLPGWAQPLYVVVFVMLAAMFGAARYLARLFREPPESEGKHVVLEAASLADMSRFNRMADSVESMAVDTKVMRTIMEEQADERKDDARIHMIVKEAMEQRPASRAPRRRRKPAAKTE